MDLVKFLAPERNAIHPIFKHVLLYPLTTRMRSPFYALSFYRVRRLYGSSIV